MQSMMIEGRFGGGRLITGMVVLVSIGNYRRYLRKRAQAGAALQEALLMPVVLTLPHALAASAVPQSSLLSGG